jgi:hypothetical protein
MALQTLRFIMSPPHFSLCRLAIDRWSTLGGSKRGTRLAEISRGSQGDGCRQSVVSSVPSVVQTSFATRSPIAVPLPPPSRDELAPPVDVHPRGLFEGEYVLAGEQQPWPLI